MRFYLDADLSWRIVAIARRLGVDVVSAHRVGMTEATDAEQLAYATQDDRCIVTKNRDDFLDLDRAYRDQGLQHHGILIVAESLPTHDFVAVARALARYHSLYPERSVPGLVDYLHPAPEDS